MNTNESVKPEGVPPAAHLPLQLRRILVPLDFSGASRRALDYAVPLAEKFNAKIILVHVVPPQVYASEVGVEVYTQAELHAAAMKTMEKRAVELVPPALLQETQVRNGQPYEEIVRLAQELDVDLIVMTTHGYTGVARIFLGSTAEQVIRHAPCPVFAVRRR